MEENMMTIDVKRAMLKKVLENRIKNKSYPLSHIQRGNYFDYLMFQESRAQYTVFSARILSNIDIEALRKSFEYIYERHDILKTVFVNENGEIRQKIKYGSHCFFEYSDRLSIDTENLRGMIQEEVFKKYDLALGPIFKVFLYKVADCHYALSISMHHIGCDFFSIPILLYELGQVYPQYVNHQPVRLKPLLSQYIDYVSWQEDYLKGENGKNDRLYWMRKLAGDLPVLSVPSDFSKTKRIRNRGQWKSYAIDARITESLHNLAREKNTTLYVLLLSAYYILLYNYTRQEDIIVGTISSGRNKAEFEANIGNYINQLPIRINVNPEMSFHELLDEVKTTLLESIEHGEYPFTLMVEKRVTQRVYDTNPIFQTMCVLQRSQVGELKNLPLFMLGDEKVKMNLGSLSLEPIKISQMEGDLDLYYEWFLIDDRLECACHYNPSVFLEKTISRMTSHYVNILESIINGPEKKICNFDLITEKEKNQILNDFNDTKSGYPDQMTIHGMFEEQVRRTPKSTAVSFKDAQLTYCKLDRLANKFGNSLLRRGVKSNSVVGIMVERSFEMLVGIMGILKAGGAYLPIDPGFPRDRIDHIIKESGIDILLIQKKFMEKINPSSLSYIIDCENPAFFMNESDAINQSISPKDLAYVIYTSGSTGNPKGVMIEHGSVINRLHWMQKIFSLGQDDTVLLKTPFTFDVSVWELFWWAFYGAKIFILNPGEEKNPQCIADSVFLHRITTIHFVPSMLHSFMTYIEKAGIANRLASLKRVIVSGEEIKHETIKRFSGLFGTMGIKLYNLYGPTEATVDVSSFDCDDIRCEGIVPIGKPIDNIRLFIMNKWGRLNPIGIPGELCIAGIGLSRGYLNNQDLTKEKFVHNELVNERIYKTGDLARWLADGNIEFLGRIDNQIKMRGYRIELGEIEHQLLSYNDVMEAIVIDKEDSDGDKQLVAYIVSKSSMDVSEVRDFLAEKLPSYMVPSVIIQLESMPLSSNGKIDRGKLKHRKLDRNIRRSVVNPSNELECKLVSMWEKILNINGIGTEDNFFSLGGHSLKAIQLLTMINKEFNVNLELSKIINAPTIRNIADAIEETPNDEFSRIDKAETNDSYPCTSIQNRIFLLNEMRHAGVAYNLPFVLKIEGKLDHGRLNRVFTELIKRHESLRTTFHLHGDEVVQRILDDFTFKIDFYDLADEKKIDECIDNFIRPFKLTEFPLIRVKLVKIPGSVFYLLLDMHHIVSDGVSMGIFIKDFMDLYEGKEIAPLQIQYRDYAVWWKKGINEKTRLSQEKYWLDQFREYTPGRSFTDFPRPESLTFNGDTIRRKLDRGLTGMLRGLARETNSTLFTLLFASYNILLYFLTGETRITVGTPVAGRRHPDLDRIIGVFINTLALSTNIDKDMKLTDYLSRVRNDCYMALENQDYPLEYILEKINICRETNRNPLFDTMFVLQNMEIPQIKMRDAKVTHFDYNYKASMVDFTFHVMDINENLNLIVQYNTNLFRKRTIEELIDNYLGILGKMNMDDKFKIKDIFLAPASKQYNTNLTVGEIEFDF
ncbi:MAG: amino acid adenylation domain-containing protein [Spirochaetales bacterium]|nr:amino acid adenylation domain-containing protein [Spirochaetales bacterium]